MNNTLFNLAREATQWCCENLSSDDLGWEHKWETKYGELIVQECLNLIGNPICPNHHYTVIQNHFGVYDEDL